MSARTPEFVKAKPSALHRILGEYNGKANPADNEPSPRMESIQIGEPRFPTMRDVIRKLDETWGMTGQMKRISSDRAIRDEYNAKLTNLLILHNWLQRAHAAIVADMKHEFAVELELANNATKKARELAEELEKRCVDKSAERLVASMDQDAKIHELNQKVAQLSCDISTLMNQKKDLEQTVAVLKKENDGLRRGKKEKKLTALCVRKGKGKGK